MLRFGRVQVYKFHPASTESFASQIYIASFFLVISISLSLSISIMLFKFDIGLALAVTYTFSVVGAKPYVVAESAIQHLNPRAQYQGGWPLALSASNTSCPADASVQCNNGDVNPGCCPAGQSCVWGSSVYAFYCCPTGILHSHISQYPVLVTNFT